MSFCHRGVTVCQNRKIFFYEFLPYKLVMTEYDNSFDEFLPDRRLMSEQEIFFMSSCHTEE
jgi:hypothetical protein